MESVQHSMAQADKARPTVMDSSQDEHERQLLDKEWTQVRQDWDEVLKLYNTKNK